MTIQAVEPRSRSKRNIAIGLRRFAQIGLLFALTACGTTPQYSLVSPDKVGPMKKVATFDLPGTAWALRWSNDGRQLASISEVKGSYRKSQIIVRNTSNWQSPTFKTDVAGHFDSPRTILEFGTNGDLLVTPPQTTEGCAGAKGQRQRCIAAIWRIVDAKLLKQLAEPDFANSPKNMPVWSQNSPKNGLIYFVFRNTKDILLTYDLNSGNTGEWRSALKSNVETINSISTVADCDTCTLVAGISSYEGGGGIDDFRSGIVERIVPDGSAVLVKTNREILWAGLTPKGDVVSGTRLAYNIAFKNFRDDAGTKINEFSFLQLWNAAGTIAFELINDPVSQGQDTENAAYIPTSNLVAYTSTIKDSSGVWWPYLSIFDVGKQKLYQKPYVVPVETNAKRLQRISRMQSPVLAWSNDGKFLALGSKQSVSIYKLEGDLPSGSHQPVPSTTNPLRN